MYHYWVRNLETMKKLGSQLDFHIFFMTQYDDFKWIESFRVIWKFVLIDYTTKTLHGKIGCKVLVCNACEHLGCMFIL